MLFGSNKPIFTYDKNKFVTILFGKCWSVTCQLSLSNLFLFQDFHLSSTCKEATVSPSVTFWVVWIAYVCPLSSPSQTNRVPIIWNKGIML